MSLDLSLPPCRRGARKARGLYFDSLVKIPQDCRGSLHFSFRQVLFLCSFFWNVLGFLLSSFRTPVPGLHRRFRDLR